jgi:transposase
MSIRELERVEVMARVASGKLSLVDAAEILRRSYRQVKRMWKKYQRAGAAGLKHGNAGKSSNRAKPKPFRRKVLNLVAQKYSGSEEERFGPTLAAEHLAEEDGMEIDEETLRRWMLAEGLWTRCRTRKPFCQRRERKRHFGELVQLDGSFHEWLEGRGPGGCLMDMVDDATSITLCRLGAQETIWAAVGILREWIRQYGVPLALYTDWKNVYKQEPTEAQRWRGEVPVTQFGRMCQALGIEIIAANSPQAKGRVERNHGTHQDRLVKKLRRKGLTTYAEVNDYLGHEYLPQHNRRFSQPAADPEDYHRRRPSARELRQIFRLETERRISNDWCVLHNGRILQLQPQKRHYGPTRAKALVCEWEDSTEVFYRGERISHEELAELPRRETPAAKDGMKASADRAFGKAHKPRADHPWRRAFKSLKRGQIAQTSAGMAVEATQ